MGTKDLMIGDYISVKPSGMPIKVAAVHHKKVAYHAVINKLAWVRESLLEPIPLTPEILEKNRFRIIFEGELHVSYFQDIESFHIEVKVDKIGIYQKLSMLDGFGNGVTIVECKFVHQLQHALRLCGIKKEIIL